MSSECRDVSVAHLSVGHTVSPSAPDHPQRSVTRLYILMVCCDLTFVGPCIVIYFYSKINQMHNISNLFYFETTLYKFRTVSPSIIRSLRLYIQYHVYVIQVTLTVSRQPQNLYGVMLYVQC